MSEIIVNFQPGTQQTTVRPTTQPNFVVQQVAATPNGHSVVTGPPGPPGPPGASGNLTGVVGEVPGGAVNGSNAMFTTTFPFVPESVEVFINGLRQRRPEHFNTTGTTTILLSDSPGAGEFLLVNYLRA